MGNCIPRCSGLPEYFMFSGLLLVICSLTIWVLGSGMVVPYRDNYPETGLERSIVISSKPTSGPE